MTMLAVMKSNVTNTVYMFIYVMKDCLTNILLCFIAPYREQLKNRNDCPAGYVRILYENECKLAVPGKNITTASDPAYPRGCHLTWGGLRLNDHPVGNVHANSALVCKLGMYL